MYAIDLHFELRCSGVTMFLSKMPLYWTGVVGGKSQNSAVILPSLMLKGWFAEDLMEIKDHYKDRRKNTGVSRAKGLRVLRKSKKSHGTSLWT